MNNYIALLSHEDYYDGYHNQLPTHRDHQVQWASQQAGRVVAIGSLPGPDFDQLWLLEAESLEEAEALVDSAPDVKRQLVSRRQILPWNIQWRRPEYD